MKTLAALAFISLLAGCSGCEDVKSRIKAAEPTALFATKDRVTVRFSSGIICDGTIVKVGNMVLYGPNKRRVRSYYVQMDHTRILENGTKFIITFEGDVPEHMITHKRKCRKK